MRAEAARAGGLPWLRRARILAGMLLVLALPRAAGAIANPAADGRIELRYVQTPLTRLVEEIARATGQRIIVDPALPGRFTMIMHRLVTPAEALALLDATLTMQGYALVRRPDGTDMVLPVTVASSGAPWKGLAAVEDRDELVTTMVDLHDVDAVSLAGTVRQYLSRDDLLVPYPDSNSLILVGNEKRLRRLIALVQALDEGGLGTLWVRTLRHRGVTEVADMLPDVVGKRFGGPELRFWTDDRTNSLIVLGTDDQLARARSFIDEIDQPPASGKDRIRVVRILNRDATDIHRMLLALAAGRILQKRDADAKAAAARPILPGVSASPPPQGAALFGKNFAVAVDEATNSLVVDADADTFRTIQEVIDDLDREQPRVQVDVTAYEITNPTNLSLGIDFFLPVLTPNSKDGTGSAFTIASNPSGGGLRGEIGPDISFFGRISRDPLTIPFVDANGNPTEVVLPRETAVIQANDHRVHTRVLMSPRLLMSSGEEQRIFVGQNVPILVGQSAENLAGVQTRSQVQRQDVGVELRVTPRLGQTGDVNLDLHIQISRVGPSQAGDVTVVGPTIEKRQIDTKVPVADGELVVIGMSQDGTQNKSQTGTPFLQDIPVLGMAVRSGSSSASDTHLIFAVQARILRDHDQDLAEAIRQRLAFERSESRLSGIRNAKNFPYALLVDTSTDRAQAQKIADDFEREGTEAQVASWQNDGQTRFDVYLTGYRNLVLAGADALRLRERGLEPQVVVLPGALDASEIRGLDAIDAASELSEADPSGAASGSRAP